MRVVVISPLFPPFADAEAFCSGKFVLGLRSAGADATVIACSNVRVPARRDRSTIWEALAPVTRDVPGRPSGVVQRCWLGLRYRTTRWSQWTHDVVEAVAALHERSPFDLIVTRSLPQQAHLAGLALRSRLQIPWMAHMNDPWEFHSVTSVGRTGPARVADLNWRMSWRRVVARADALSFPSARLRDYCLRLAASRRQAGVFVFPHIAAVGKAGKAPNAGEFRLVHAGRLGINDPTGRSAATLLDGLAELFRRRPAARTSTRLIFVGPDDPETSRHAQRTGVSPQVTSTGVVSYEESLDQIAAASVAVLVEGDLREGIFLPSKLCDYVGARKPVLALGPDRGTVADLAADGGILRAGTRDTARVAGALTELFDAYRAGRLDDWRPRPSLAHRFDSDTVTTMFLNSVAGFLPAVAEAPSDRQREAS